LTNDLGQGLRSLPANDIRFVIAQLTPGEQVVTFGSFFIDADYKLKGP
jgi:hypothetical protein